MKHKKHNPYYRLVEFYKESKNGYINLVYGIANDGTNEGLEIYFHKQNDLHHYSSRRYLQADIPAIYRGDYVCLRLYNRRGAVQDGHKLTINPEFIEKITLAIN